MSNLPESQSNPKAVFKNTLRSTRILKNPKISQWKLSLKSGVPQSKISLIENWLVNPTQEEKENLASALDTDVLHIFSNGPIEKGEKE